jgi:hydroxyacylglutathione hydrolase
MYLVVKNTEGIIIDPGYTHEEEKDITDKIRTVCSEIPAVILTHGHYDHISGLDHIKQTFNSTILCHEQEADKLQSHEKNGAALFDLNAPLLPPADKYLTDDQNLDLLGLRWQIFHTPGHTRGGISVLLENQVLFSGDTLFKSGIGRTDLYDGSYDAEIDSILHKILNLPSSTAILPGHGPATTVEAERTHFKEN